MLLDFSQVPLDGGVPDEKSTKKSTANFAETSKPANYYELAVGAECLRADNVFRNGFDG